MSPINEDGLQRDSAVGAMTVTKHVDLVHSVSERQELGSGRGSRTRLLSLEGDLS